MGDIIDGHIVLVQVHIRLVSNVTNRLVLPQITENPIYILNINRKPRHVFKYISTTTQYNFYDKNIKFVLVTVKN